MFKLNRPVDDRTKRLGSGCVPSGESCFPAIVDRGGNKRSVRWNAMLFFALIALLAGHFRRYTFSLKPTHISAIAFILRRAMLSCIGSVARSWSVWLARQDIFTAGLVTRLSIYARPRTALHQAFKKAS